LREIRSRLTYANVIATLALFLVLAGGTAFATGRLGKGTVGARQLKKNAVTTAKIKNGAVTAAKIAAGALPSTTNAKTADHATTADTANKATTAKTAEKATTATSASTATNAATAANALSLGGVPASGYTRSDCASVTGQVKGFARIEGPAVSKSGLSTAGVVLPYNCSGGSVLAEYLGGGAYKVVFSKSPVVIAVANSTDTFTSGHFQKGGIVSVNPVGPGEFEVETFSADSGAGYIGSFEILTP
jgi:hypothetical protein